MRSLLHERRTYSPAPGVWLHEEAVQLCSVARHKNHREACNTANGFRDDHLASVDLL